MSHYLDEYGVAEARRERLLKRGLAVAAILAAAGGLAYWQFKDFREERQVRAFFELLQKQDYRAAYALWGCTEENPCPQYSFEKFMEDWGQNAAANVSAFRLGGSRSCPDGLIQTVTAGDEEIHLWVNRSDHVLSFAPWPVCHPRLPPETATSPSG
ncbi:MAG: hypothetical protein KIT09_17515 [Bryobacteraceae bacterium]|nr:hypothetical protein [Bryobacteraceae bacterium]